MYKIIISILSTALVAMIGYVGFGLVDWVGLPDKAIVAVSLVVATVGLGSWFATRDARLALLPALVTLSFLTCTVVDISPTQPAQRAVKRIRNGMDEATVRAIIREEFPRRYLRKGTGELRAGQTLWLNVGSGGTNDSAWLLVKFSAGRVSSREFVAD